MQGKAEATDRAQFFSYLIRCGAAWPGCCLCLINIYLSVSCRFDERAIQHWKDFLVRRDKQQCFFVEPLQETQSELPAEAAPLKSRYIHKAMDTVLKLATTEDQGFLSELFNNARSVEFAPLGLPEQALTQLLAMQFRAQQSGYAAQFPQALDRILWSGTTRIGRFLVNQSEDEIRLVDIALLAPYRGQGRGGHVIQGLCVQAIKAGLPLRLSVRFGNPAERLYERLGFVRTGGDGVYVTMEFREPGAIAVKPEPHLEEEAGGDVEQGFTRAYFRTWTGHTVKATSLDGVEVELSVVDVKALQAPIGGPPIDVGDSFVIYFRGPVRPALPTACADLKPEIGETMSIFLVPIACDADGMKYEAIFNRMKARL